MAPERPRAVPLEQRAEDRGGRPLTRRPVRRPRSSTSARVRDAVCRSNQASVAAEVRPAISSSARRSAATARTSSIRSRTRLVSTAAASADAISSASPARRRSSGPSMSTPRRQRRRRSSTDQPADLGQPARQGVVAELVGDGREGLGRRGDRDGVGREAVVRERTPIARTRGTDQVAAVAPGRERDRAGPQDDQPVRSLGADEPPEPPAERCIVGRRADDPDVGRARGGEPAPVPLGEPRPGRPDPALDRAGGRAGHRVEDADGDGSHRPSLAVTREATVAARRVRAYIGLGANVGDPEATLAEAVRALAGLPGTRLRGVSRLYVTAPWGEPDQPDFRNAVVALDVPGDPDPATAALRLLGRLKDLERDFGRRERRALGPARARPRPAACSVAPGSRSSGHRRRARSTPRSDPARAARLLEVPHRDAARRLFVLAPLADLAPGLVPPGWGETVATARRRQAAAEAPTRCGSPGLGIAAAGRWRPVRGPLTDLRGRDHPEADVLVAVGRRILVVAVGGPGDERGCCPTSRPSRP